jgi:hypothetical protein
MEPITREEYYLAKIAGTYKGKTPKPVTIEEYYLATMAGDYSGNTPQPVTRLQYYMAKVAGVWDGSIPAPVTRLEYYWAAIANGEGEVFPPVTREEHFLTLVADAYSVVLTVVTGNPALLEGVKGNRFTSLTLHGKSTQGSTTGAQLFDVSNADVVQMYIANSGIGNFIENYSVVIPIKPSTSYTISEKNKKIFRVAITEEYPIESAPTLFKEVVDVYKNITTPNNLPNGNFLMIQLYGNFNHAPDFSGLMLNEGSTPKPYEPYTGGAPSPSPSYPQEIENAGQSGEIGVQVYGGNLFDIRKASPWEDAYGLQMSLDGEYITVKGVTTTTRYGNISFRILGYPVNLYGNRFSLDIVKNVGTSKEYVYTSATENTLALSVVVDAKAAVELKFRLMVNAGSTALPYEPYKPAQKLIIPTPNGLPGVPTIDNGNYTDASGQQWLCDEVDLKRGVYVQNVAFAEFGKEITVLKKNNAVSNENFVAAYFFTLPPKRIKTRQTILSNCLSYVESINKVNKPYSISNEFDTEAMYVTIPTELYENDVQMLNLLAEKKIKILYATYPTERPLSTKELEKYRSLRTYSPTTTVINDAGAGMSVGYAKMK